MAFSNEDYSNARTLAEFEYMGEKFRVVRRRFNGKHWRKYLMVLHVHSPITNDFYWETTDPKEYVAFCLELMQRRLTTRKSLDEGLEVIHA